MCRYMLAGVMGLLLCSSSLWASDSKEEITDSQLLHYVGQIRWKTPGQIERLCTASRVGRRLLLTAEHCLPMSDGVFDGATTTAYFYPSVYRGTIPRGAQRVRIRNAWTGQARFNFETIARIIQINKLLDDLPKDWAIAYLEELPFATDAENEDFMRVSWAVDSLKDANLITVGYGGQGLKIGSPFIDDACAVLSKFSWVKRYFYGTDCHAEEGDSGGPVMIEDAGVYVQVGVLTAAAANKDTTEYRSSFIALDAFIHVLVGLKKKYRDFHPDANHEASQVAPQRTSPPVNKYRLKAP